MYQYLKIPGLVVGDAAPAADLLPEDIAMGHIPDWLCLFDPEYASDGGAYDRARPPVLAEVDSSPNHGIPRSVFPNGQPAFNPTSSAFTSWNADVAFPRDAWTVFAVVRTASGSTGSAQFFVGPKQASPESSPIPAVGLSQDNAHFRVWAHGSAVPAGAARIGYTPSVGFLNRTALLMATFSIRDGLRLFENGVQVAANAADKAPIAATYAPGEWNFLRFTRGLYGMTGVLSRDLGQAENAPYRKAIETFLLTKYGIAP